MLMESRGDLVIYQQGVETASLPLFIEETDEGLRVGNAIEGSPGPFQRIYDFGQSRIPFIKVVPWAERLTANSVERVYFAGFDHPDVVEKMAQLTRINHEKSPDDDGVRFHYQKALFQAFQPIIQRVQELADLNNALILPPLNGGVLILTFFRAQGAITNSNIIDFELKRILRPEGHLLVGAKIHKVPEGNFTTAVVIDDCLATDGSACASFQMAKELHPEINQAILAVSVASQKGTLALNQAIPELGYQEHQLLAAVPCFALNEEYYLMRVLKEGFGKLAFVGDMGAWAKALPKSFNDRAPWNINR